MKHLRPYLLVLTCFCLLISSFSFISVQGDASSLEETPAVDSTSFFIPGEIPSSLHGAALFKERYGRVYSAPSEESLCLTELFTPECFLVFSRNEEWTCILYHGLPAYLSSSLLTFYEDRSSPYSHTGIVTLQHDDALLLYPYLPDKWTDPLYGISVDPDSSVSLLGIHDDWAEVSVGGNTGFLPTSKLSFLPENREIGNTTANPYVPISEASEKMWSFFKEKGLSDEASAALIGNIYSESALNTMNLENTYETLWGYTDASYTADVNNGSYSRERFISDQAGYGLCQWTSAYRKAQLYDMAGSHGVSIHDIGIQMEIIWGELNAEHAYLLDYLRYPLSLRQASDIVLSYYMVPAIQNDYIRDLRLSYCLTFYEAFR